MKANDLEITGGTGNVFHDLGKRNVDIEQLNILAASVLRIKDALRKC